MMSEHQRETAFLRHCIRYDESPGRQELDERITRIQRDERCVRRAAWLMLLVAALAVAGLGYSAIFLTDYTQDLFGFMTQFITKVFCALGLASLICLLAFMGLEVVYRKQLDLRREECRQLVMKLMESRLGRPGAAYLPGVVNEPGNLVSRKETVVSAPMMNLSRAR
jgi:uncharacterized membrane protein YuzA (DUF378 family)